MIPRAGALRGRGLRSKCPAMSGFLEILLYIVIAAVTLVLAGGIYALFRGGDFGRTWSNKLMRARVLFQFLAILLVVAIVWLQRAGAG